jgi:hypothetical protein
MESMGMAESPQVHTPSMVDGDVRRPSTIDLSAMVGICALCNGPDIDQDDSALP